MKTNHYKQGFSLVEMLVAVLAAAILILIVSLLLVMPFRVMKTNNEHAEIRRDMAIAVQTMAKDIRNSSAGDITVAANILTLPANDVRPVATTYTRSGDALNSSTGGEIISAGLTVFNPMVTNDLVSGMSGVILNIEMENNSGDISVTHQTFIHTRN